ncbi:DedA family protein [Actinomadura scrupuli]|uniref:DedA family protein n=1 Tax=Actinomadura scrupuli TaxID=559629 RepID=UPI003D9858CE
MIDAVLDLLSGAVTSPWVYPLLFAIALLDGVLPVLPAESLLITAGMYAAGGQPNIFLVVLLGAAGAAAGDHVAYLIGRFSGGRLGRWMPAGTRRGNLLEWAGRTLAARGGLILVVARYIAGGRNAATLTMGAVGYPMRSFSFFDGIGTLSWALASSLIGYLGGVAFQGHPVRGVLFGIGLALAVTALVEGVRHLRRLHTPVVEDSGGRLGGEAAGAVTDSQGSATRS